MTIILDTPSPYNYIIVSGILTLGTAIPRVFEGIAPISLHVNHFRNNQPKQPADIEITERVHRFAEEMGLARKLDVYFIRGPLGKAYGDSENSTRAGIIFDENFSLLDMDAQNFIIRHEISHILANDQTNLFIASLATMVSGIGISSILQTGNPTIDPLITCAASSIGYLSSVLLLSKRFENYADENAMKYCTDEEKFQAAQLFINTKIIIEGKKNNGLTWWERTKAKFYELPTHPSYLSRVNKLVNSIKDNELRDWAIEVLNEDLKENGLNFRIIVV